ncbi:MAG: glycosyltransferase family 2 protein [Caldilinea sp.]|nr:glycosyltransferase family 2 protein [Caldilinea sp.]MDW8442206.1 glycosyltransferase family 2 protein [Caldilineaceae bacterium]
MSNSSQTIFLSIIIPAYNEERRLPPSLEKVVAFLQRQTYKSEVIVVENGSTDRTTEVVQAFIEAHQDAEDKVRLALLHSSPGKGAAVKVGMLAAQGDYRFICDADLAMPIEEIVKFLPPVQRQGMFDIAIASREAPGAVRYNEPLYRHIMGRVFNLLVRMMAVPGIQDTQCGFKMFTRQAALHLFPLQQIDGWSFDVEVLYIARQHGLRLIEVPIHWHYQEDSRVRPVHDTVNMVRELLKIRRNGRAGLYNLPAPQSTVDEIPAS